MRWKVSFQALQAILELDVGQRFQAEQFLGGRLDD